MGLVVLEQGVHMDGKRDDFCLIAKRSGIDFNPN